MKKSKLALLLLAAALAWSCSDSYGPVTIPFRASKVADFAAFADVYFVDFISDVGEAGIDAQAEVRRTFREEVPFAIDRKVVLLEPAHWDTIRGILLRYRLDVDIDYENSVFFRNVFRAHPRSLFFTGKLKLDVKKMGVIKETRDEKGNRKNAYETVQMWEMTARVFLIDGDAGRVLLQETYSEKLEPAPGTTPQFNFNSLFARLTAKLTSALQPRKVLQERFLITR
jgi:hypothetical protein